MAVAGAGTDWKKSVAADARVLGCSAPRSASARATTRRTMDDSGLPSTSHPWASLPPESAPRSGVFQWIACQRGWLVRSQGGPMTHREKLTGQMRRLWIVVGTGFATGIIGGFGPSFVPVFVGFAVAVVGLLLLQFKPRCPRCSGM